MPLVSEWTPKDPIQLLVYGKFKLGKTWGACTFPRPVMFDFDDGAATARNPKFVEQYGVRWLFYDTFQDSKRSAQGIVTSHEAFDRACRMFDEWMKPKGKWTDSLGKQYETGRDMFDTFIIDSGTTLSLLSMAKATIVLGSQNLSKTQEQALKSGVLIPKMQDWGAERSLTEQFVRMVKDSGKNVVVICHEKEVMDNSDTVTAIVPLFTGKSAELIPIMFDEVYNLRVRAKGLEQVRYLQTVPDSLRRCGSRYGIPNECTWDYDTLKGHIDKIHQAQVKSQSAGGQLSTAGSVTSTVK